MDPRRLRVRLLFVAVVALLWGAATLGRLAYLQLFCYGDYLARAQRQQQRLIEITPRRGVLYDRNLHELAVSLQVDACFAVPAEIADPAMVARLLAPILGIPREEIETRLASSRSYARLARKLDPATVERIAALNLRGIYFEKENHRFYPKRQLASHVLGHVDIDENGQGGVEYAFDSQIRGRPGRMMILTDARHRWYERSEEAADDGASAVLTLDEKIQYIAEKELAAAIQETHAQAGTIIVQDPGSGELLAAANWPPFNPNAVSDSKAEARMNRAVGALYEPGSTFKVITVAAALDEGLAGPEEVIDCQMGAIYLNGHRIRDHKPFGLLTLSEVVAKSSDVGAIKVGLRLGAPKLYQYIRAFGFGGPTGIDLPGENRGLLRRLENWSRISIGAVSMGQEVGVTPVQLITAFSALANGGLLYRPHVLLQLRRNGRVIPAEQPAPRRVVRPETAATLRRMLERVILEGTGAKARLDGYTAGGKTGTAQKIDPATGRYSRTQYVASFAGFAPLNNPAISVLVALDSPAGPHQGGEVAAPVFKRVAQQTLAYLEAPRDVELSPGIRRAAHRPAGNDLAADASDFDPLQTETAPSEAPPPAEAPQQEVPTGAPAPALKDGRGIAVPSFAGQTVREVTEECLRAGLSPVLVGTGVAVGQMPSPGQAVRRGSRVTVRFARSTHWLATSGRGH